MKRQFVTRKKFYDIRRDAKNWKSVDYIETKYNISKTTILRVYNAHNFREYKEMGKTYGKGVKVLRLRYMFILFIIAIMAMFINLLTK